MIQVRKVVASLIAVTLPVIAGCSAKSTTPAPVASFVYYSTFACTAGDAALGVVAYPMTSSSTPTLTLNDSVANGLSCPAEILVDGSGRLFVLNDVAPYTIPVFTLPLSATSTPAFTLTMPAGTMNAFNMAFDGSGNLWVSSTNNNTIYEFNGPFNTTTTLVPAVTLTTTVGTCSRPEQPGFDLSGNLYVACEGSSGSNAVAVWLKGAGFTTGQAIDHNLNGPHAPEALAFDKSGNLYVGSNAASPNGGIAFYMNNNLAAGATPNFYDSTGMAATFFPDQFAFDPVGNLYDADCGSAPGKVYVYPTGSSALSATLALSATYTDANLTASGCTGGVAIH